VPEQSASSVSAQPPGDVEKSGIDLAYSESNPTAHNDASAWVREDSIDHSVRAESWAGFEVSEVRIKPTATNGRPLGPSVLTTRSASTRSIAVSVDVKSLSVFIVGPHLGGTWAATGAKSCKTSRDDERS
jgi:hypothetical protein